MARLNGGKKQVKQGKQVKGPKQTYTHPPKSLKDILGNNFKTPQMCVEDHMPQSDLLAGWYVGQLDVTGVPDGFGTSFYKRDRKQPRYHGHIKHGAPHGEGYWFAEDGKLIYWGQWKNGKYHGRGTEFFPSRGGVPRTVKYTGGWKNDVREGWGISRSESGRKLYMGTWLGGRPHGRGVSFREEDGTTEYTGGFSRGVEEGHGVFYFANGRIDYEGDVKQGKEHGYGISYDEETGNLEYEGNWENGKAVGFGRAWRDGKPVYFGHWSDDKQEGYGEAFDEEGRTKHRGYFENDLPEGWGTAYDGEGRPTYEGEWLRGLQHGLGRAWERGVEIYHGEFSYGVSGQRGGDRR